MHIGKMVRSTQEGGPQFRLAKQINNENNEENCFASFFKS